MKQNSSTIVVIMYTITDVGFLLSLGVGLLTAAAIKWFPLDLDLLFGKKPILEDREDQKSITSHHSEPGSS